MSHNIYNILYIYVTHNLLPSTSSTIYLLRYLVCELMKTMSLKSHIWMVLSSACKPPFTSSQLALRDKFQRQFYLEQLEY